MDSILIILLVLLLGCVLAILYLNLKSKPKDENENKHAEEIANLKSEISNLKDTLNTTINTSLGLYCSTRWYFCFSDIITVSAPRRSGRPLLWLSGCPSIVATICHPLPGVVVHLLFGCFFSCSGVGRPTSSHLLCMVSCSGLFLCFTLFYHAADQKCSVIMT